MDLAAAGFSLSIHPIANLRPHEETIPSHVEAIAEDLRRDHVQKDPILIDGRSRAVLDGMHRIAAFHKLGLENAVCCSVEYDRDSVLLGRWARVYEDAAVRELELLVKEVGFGRQASRTQAISELDKRKTGLAAFLGESVLLPDRKMTVAEAFAMVREIDKASQMGGWGRKFVRDDELDGIEQLQRKLIILVERLLKSEVVSAAVSGKLFPCKTSLHSVDPRPVAVNFPISELSNATTADLQELLGKTEGRILPANSVYGGRRYKERLLLLNPV
ncbi:MAG: hypothetical protein OK404_01960 [Thaumarchaeota archaeon]|nr:hypothetical protein [Nitrososphaerota archaeon]